MNIQPISVNQYSNQKKSNPSFGAIHPCLYYVKCGEESYRLITDADLIKNNLQKKIITWLNHNYNAKMKRAQGSTAKSKSETPETKALRERLIRFFLNNDVDYKAQDRTSSYYNTDMTTGMVRPYIFTGRSIGILDSLADNIKRVQSETKRLTEDLQNFYRLSYAESKARATKEMEFDLQSAKSAYHETVMKLLRSPEAKSNPRNTVFSAFFEEKVKGKKITYELINANFEQRLV